MRYGFVVRLQACAAALSVVGALLAVLAGGASAATFHPVNGEQLEEAVTTANSNKEANTIVLTGVDYIPNKTLTLTDTSGVQTIEGPAGSPSVRGETANITGSGIEPVAEVLVIKSKVSATFKNIEVDFGGKEGLPAVEDQGALTVENSLLANTGTSIAVEPGSTLTVKNSTISDGRDYGIVNQGTTSIFNSTIAFNLVGIENTIGDVLNLTNTIVANNKLGDCEGKATTSDHSLDSNGSCGVGLLSKTNPLLATTLENAGGDTPVHLLKAGSPAIGAGNPATCTAADQRGEARANPCSIGAVENSVQFGSTPSTSPYGVAVSSTGNVYVADKAGNVVREFSHFGVLLRTIGAYGSANGQLWAPDGVAVTSAGNLYVADQGNLRVEEFNEKGEFVRKFGAGGLTGGFFASPAGIAVDNKGHVFVSDAAFLVGSSRIEEFSEEGAFIRQFGTQGKGNGELIQPGGVAVDFSGNVYVADTWNCRVEKFTGEGVYVSQFSSFGTGNGQLFFPESLGLDASGNIYVADTVNSRVEEFSSAGAYLAKFGTYGAGGGQYAFPQGLGLGPEGRVYVGDTINKRVTSLIP